MENVGIFYVYFVYFMAIGSNFMVIWYILWSFGIFFPVLVRCPKKNLATLAPTIRYRLCLRRLELMGRDIKSRRDCKDKGPML
jgi:hypothetical protein